MYGGELFTGYLNISEATISKVFSAPQSEVELLLSNLEKFEIIQYDKHKDKPQLTFLTGRYDAQQLPLQVQDIEQRREYDVQKALAVKHYIEHQKRCRTQLLLEYFDEHTDATCGVCDVCIKKKREEGTYQQELQYKFQTQEKVKALLSNGSMSPELLLKIMQPNNTDLFKAIVREMIENQQISVDSEGNLTS